MKYSSALFLVLIIAPLAFSQSSEVLNMIQKTDEGKEVFDSIFLDTSLAGPHLNAASINGRLNAFANYVRGASKAFRAAEAANKKECHQNLHAVRSRFHDFTLRATAARRVLANTKKIAARRATILRRAQEELQTYQRFANYNQSNQNAWKAFWAQATKSIRTATELISRVRTQVARLHRKNRRAAFIELPQDYNGALTEIATEFENNMDNLGGLRPIIANLLEIAKNKKHLRKRHSRRQLRRFLGLLAERFHDDVNTFTEENEHQQGLFEGLTSLFGDSIARSRGVVHHLNHLQKQTAIKINWLNGSVKGRAYLTQLSRNVVDAKAEECRSIAHFIHNTQTRFRRILEVIAQLQEVLNDRFHNFRSFLENYSSQN